MLVPFQGFATALYAFAAEVAAVPPPDVGPVPPDGLLGALLPAEPPDTVPVAPPANSFWMASRACRDSSCTSWVIIWVEDIGCIGSWYCIWATRSCINCWLVPLVIALSVALLLLAGVVAPVIAAATTRFPTSQPEFCPCESDRGHRGRDPLCLG